MNSRSLDLMNSRCLDLLNSRTLDLLTYHITHITHIAPHHSAKKFLGRKWYNMIYQHITNKVVKPRTAWTCPTHLTTSLSEEVLGPESTRITTKNVAATIRATRKVWELPRKMNIQEVEEPESTRITTKNAAAKIAATPKLRKFTYKTNMQARKYVNSDEFRPPPRSSHPAFYHYRKNPKC